MNKKCIIFTAITAGAVAGALAVYLKKSCMLCERTGQRKTEKEPPSFTLGQPVGYSEEGQ